MTADYLTDRSAIALYGVTGARTRYGGKTAVANWWASRWGVEHFDIVLFLNPKGTSTVKGTRVGGWDEIGEEIDKQISSTGKARSGCFHFNIVPRTADWEGFSDEMRVFVENLPRDWSKAIVWDEAPELSDDALLWAVRVAGQEDGINAKSWVVAQDPVSLHPRVRSQPIPAWVGPVTEENRDWFQSKSYLNHYETIDENDTAYHWYVMTGPEDSDLDHYNPVPEEYA